MIRTPSLKAIKIFRDGRSPVDRQVQTQQFGELVAVETQHLREVGAPVFVGVDGADSLSIVVRISIDGGRHHRQFRDQIYAVFVYVLRAKSTKTMPISVTE